MPKNITIQKILGILLHRLPMIILSGILVALIFFVYTSVAIKPVYNTSAMIYILNYGSREKEEKEKSTQEATSGNDTAAESSAKQMDSYDLGTTIDIADLEFNRMVKSPWCAGEFVWTGIDYLGEPIPFRTEARSSSFGIVDLTGVPKDRYWLYRAYWNKKEETVHILPHWNWEGRSSLTTNHQQLTTIPVFVYTSGDSAELFINGRSQGMRRKGPCDLPGGRTNSCYRVCGKYRLMWFDTVYEPGELKAVAYRHGKRIGEAVVRTAGKPVALKLTHDYDDGEFAFFQVEAVDAAGVANPLADDRLSFSVSGPGRIVAVGNGNPRAMESFADPSAHSLFFGKAVVVVRRDAPGPITLVAAAEQLETAKMVMQSPRPARK